MKIQIKDFGPISSFTFFLDKDLNVILGKNNIGKSYAITVIYLIIKKIIQASNGNTLLLMRYFFRTGDKSFFQADNAQKELNEIANIEETATKQLLSNKNRDTTVNKHVEKILKNLLEQIFINELEKSINNSFDSISSLDNQISKKQFSIILYFDAIDIVITRRKNSLTIEKVKLKKHFVIRKINSTRKTKIETDKITSYFNQKRQAKRTNLINDSILLADRSLNEISNLVKNVYFLPASRSGLYQALSTFSAVIAELSKNRNFLSNKIELPDISEPVSDYFLYLSKISRTDDSNNYKEIASKIEELILNGEITFNKKNKKIVFKPENIDSELDLSNVSSMVAEIAPIVAYLKYIIDIDQDEFEGQFGIIFRPARSNDKGKNLIFIEEPEAHLHPEVQVLLMEMFVRLLDFETKIVMTSHSNYMFNKLSNLLLSKSVTPDIVGSYLMIMKELGSTNDEMTMKAEEDGIEDENFVNVAERLYNERMTLFENLEKS